MALDLGALARGAGHAARDGGHELLGVARRELLGAADAAQAVGAARDALADLDDDLVGEHPLAGDVARGGEALAPGSRPRGRWPAGGG